MRARTMLVSAAALSLAGCSFDTVDSFSTRAISYNLEAEQSQDSQMLLNIARGSMRRPPQFTGLQTVTGTASLSGSGQVSFGPKRASASGVAMRANSCVRVFMANSPLWKKHLRSTEIIGTSYSAIVTESDRGDCSPPCTLAALPLLAA